MRRLSARGEDEGFTLIELLVVIIIIGLLAAIAIPVFLNQRQKAGDAAAKSDLRNLANFEEVYLIDFSIYGTLSNVMAVEGAIHPSHDVTLAVVRFDAANGYCLSAVENTSGHTWWYDSQNGGLQPQGVTGCPVTVSGTAGGAPLMG